MTKEEIDNLLTEINKQDVWLSIVGYNSYNVDIALNSIRKTIKESEVKQWEKEN